MHQQNPAPLLLSHLLTDGAPVYPGDPCVRIRPALTLERNGVAVTALAFGSHAGTHVDAPAHTVPGGRTVDQLTHAELCGEALVLGLAGVGPGEEIDADRITALLDAATPVPVRVLLHTGWDAHWDAPAGPEREHRLRSHPHLSAEAAARLWDCGVRLLGTDCLSPDPTSPVPEAGDGFPVHALFLGRDGVLLENLAHLGALRPEMTGAEKSSAEATDTTADWRARVHLEVHPLPLAGADGAPARVLARPHLRGGHR
ncbi:cyclase family protein [Micrococcus sp.]|uniref:cyclase family protein n=1 Tax=Micrococcus sp. TaxID=1271 RepID=UPI002A917C09|nr:cyclase family protein [Micrococcus sp.]MDY6054629.1 cyclase family protein [Micrococcus sp.]